MSQQATQKAKPLLGKKSATIGAAMILFSLIYGSGLGGVVVYNLLQIGGAIVGAIGIYLWRVRKI